MRGAQVHCPTQTPKKPVSSAATKVSDSSGACGVVFTPLARLRAGSIPGELLVSRLARSTHLSVLLSDVPAPTPRRGRQHSDDESEKVTRPRTRSQSRPRTVGR
jgi:hypothetical protein